MLDLGERKQTNLGRLANPFVGRGIELHHVETCVDEGRRPITIVGPGGAGKTRLLQEVGHRLLPRFSGPDDGGVWFIGLNEARTLTDIVLSTATVLGVSVAKTQSMLDTLGRAIAGRKRVLLLFDNFEQLVEHGPDTLNHWLETAPEASMVISSRERLLLPGEQLISIGSLGLPDQTCASVDEFLDSEAGKLLIDRVRSVRSGYNPDSSEATSLTNLVWRLDGMPLALELAGARFATLNPSQLLERLERRFEILSRRTRLPHRHDSLKTCIDWSWEMLSPVEQSVLAQCYVFSGGFDIDAAEAILEKGEGASTL
ncbi:MAG: AAA family ATPase, partial [Proteobacteria bacterium]|nr:AAA family ATPase [Pseudomonadota bacterium]